VIPFSVIVLDVLRHRAPEVPFPERYDPIETFFLDGSDESRRVGIRIGRPLGNQHDANARLPEPTPHVAAPVMFHGWIASPSTADQTNVRRKTKRRLITSKRSAEGWNITPVAPDQGAPGDLVIENHADDTTAGVDTTGEMSLSKRPPRVRETAAPLRSQ
jgi:hypothetical protein